MLDTDTTPGPGHNKPPAYDPDIHAELSERVAKFLEATQAWLKLEAVKDEETAGHMADQINGLRGLYKTVDTARKEAKKPHDDAGKEVQLAYNPLLEKLGRAADALKPKLAAYATEKAKAEAERRREEERAARIDAEQAAERARMAAAEGDIGAQVEAEEQAKAAEKAAAQAAKAPKAQVTSATGAGRTMATRTIKNVKITNPRMLFMALQDHPEVLACLERVATQTVRAKGYDHENAPLPGIELIETPTIA